MDYRTEMEVIGLELAKQRKAKGYTVTKLQKITGLSRNAINKIERPSKYCNADNAQGASISSIIRYADALDINIYLRK